MALILNKTGCTVVDVNFIQVKIKACGIFTLPYSYQHFSVSVTPDILLAYMYLEYNHLLTGPRHVMLKPKLRAKQVRHRLFSKYATCLNIDTTAM